MVGRGSEAGGCGGDGGGGLGGGGGMDVKEKPLEVENEERSEKGWTSEGKKLA